MIHCCSAWLLGPATKTLRATVFDEAATLAKTVTWGKAMDNSVEKARFARENNGRIPHRALAEK